MGIFDALTAAVAGLQAQSFALQNISGNIANSQTIAYKETDTAFQDLVSAAMLRQQTAGGVLANSVSTNTVQGSIQSQSVATNMAIDGDGWFVVGQPTGSSAGQAQFGGVNYYTRRGDFQMNQGGYLVNGAGYYLMGIPINPLTGNPEVNSPQVLQFNNSFMPAHETSEIDYQANLPATPSVGLLNPDDFEANPLFGAPIPAQITGSGAKLKPDAPAVGTGTVDLTSNTAAAGDLLLAVSGTTYTVAITASESLANIESAINAGTGGALTASDDGSGHLVLTANDNTSSVTVGGTDGAALGFGAGNLTFNPVNLLTQEAVSQGQTLTVTVGGTTQKITFGTDTAAGQVETLAGLQTALNQLVTNFNGNLTASMDASGDITLAASGPNANTETISLDGSTASLANFGIKVLDAYPASNQVIGNDVSTFNSESIDGGSITAYDAQGNAVNVNFRWAKVANAGKDVQDTWQLFYQTNSGATGTQPAWQNVGTNFTFNSSGELSPPITSLPPLNLTVNGDTLSNVTVKFGTNGLTQFASSSSSAQVNELKQNGFAAGQLQSISVDSHGRVVGTFSNGQTIALAEISLATFNGENSLQPLNGEAYAATADSGPAIYSATGSIIGSSLEASNVDIATQFSHLIVAQQAYSSNAKVMTTANQMIQSLLQVIP
jgi:flagellar hook protein FlgE